MPPPRYKINAQEIEVIDKNNVFEATDLEGVLFELYKTHSQSLKFETLIEEKPQNTNYNFIQDYDLEVYRENNNTNVIFDGNNSRIRIQPGALGGTNQKTIFTSKKIIKYPLIFVSATFQSNSDAPYNFIQFNIKKVNNNFYALKIPMRSSPSLFRVENNNYSLIGTTNYTVPKGKKNDFVFYFYGNKFYFLLNNSMIMSTTDPTKIKTNLDENTIGQFQIIVNCYSSASMDTIDIHYIKIGSFVHESQRL